VLKPSQAKEDLKLTFNALPQTERDKIFDVKIRKIPTKEINTDTTLESEKLEQQSDELMKPSPQQLKQQVKQKSENVENDATVGDVQNLD
jgi:chromatin assembly factor 1 subunit A